MTHDDLLGAEPPKRGRPSNEERARRAEAAMQQAARQAEIKRAGSGLSKISVEDLKFLPVSQNWLARFFEMDPMTVRKRLAGQCEPLGKSGHNKEVYSFHEAIQYIIVPKMTPEQFVKTLNKANLPPEINNAFWAAQRGRIRYKLEAQEAWDTEDVLSFLGDVAMSLKDSLTMSIEEMRQQAKLDDEQAALFETMLDGMRQNIVDKLMEIPLRRETKSLADKPLFGVSADELEQYPIPDEDDGE